LASLTGIQTFLLTSLYGQHNSARMALQDFVII
jgi:hypothetical protein